MNPPGPDTVDSGSATSAGPPWKGRHARNVVWSAADYGTQLLLWFAATPLLVSALGPARYGVWIFAQAIIGFSWVLSFGIGDGIIRHLSRLRGERRHPEIPLFLQSACTVQTALGLGAASLLVLGASWITVQTVGGGVSVREEAEIALRVAGAGILVRFLDGCFTSAQYAYQRFDLPAFVNIPTAFLSLGGSVVLARAGGSIGQMLALAAGVGLAGVLAKALVLHYGIGVPFLRHFRVRLDPIRAIVRFGSMIWLQGLAWALVTQADRFLVVAFRSAEELTYYVVPFQAAQQIQAVTARVFSFVFPLFSSRRAEGDSGGVERSYIRTVHLTTLTAAGLGVPLLLLADPLLSVWVGNDFALNSALPLQILVGVFVLSAMSIGPMNLLNASGRERLNAALSLISAVVVTGVTVALLPSFGIAGAAVAKVFLLPTTVAALLLASPGAGMKKRVLVWAAAPLLVVLVITGLALPWFAGVTPDWILLAAIALAAGPAATLLVLLLRRFLSPSREWWEIWR